MLVYAASEFAVVYSKAHLTFHFAATGHRLVSSGQNFDESGIRNRMSSSFFLPFARLSVTDALGRTCQSIIEIEICR
jgi:hypothetical protein